MIETALILLVVGVVVWSLDKVRMKLPDVSDEEFVVRLASSASSDAVLSERRYMAVTLGVPYAKLSPELTWAKLTKAGPIIGFSVGFNDLADDILHDCRQVGLAVPEPFPETIGETLLLLLRLRRLQSSQVPADIP